MDCRKRILGNGSQRRVGMFAWLGTGSIGRAGGFAGSSSLISKRRIDCGIKISLPFGEIVHRPAKIRIVISEMRAGWRGDVQSGDGWRTMRKYGYWLRPNVNNSVIAEENAPGVLPIWVLGRDSR